jgi:hypothetical protein
MFLSAEAFGFGGKSKVLPMTFFRSSRATRSGFSAAMGAAPLSDAELARVAPSTFATEAHASRSARYAYIPTADVIAGLRREASCLCWRGRPARAMPAATATPSI